jgi:capsular exopolysaccharide synthesis family protein
MDAPASHDALLPMSATTAPPKPLRAGSWDEPIEAASAVATPHRAITVRVALRALRRHWWRILAVWFVISAVLVALAYAKVKPVYEATAWLKVEPSARSLLAPSSGTSGDFGPYLETQVLLVTSPDVLGSALQDRKVAALPRILGSLDPEADLRRDVKAANQIKTHLITVAMAGDSPDETATIVNAVVDAYVKAARSWTDQETRAQIEKLEELGRKYESDIARQKDALHAAIRKAGAEEMNLKDKNRVSLETWRQFKTQLGQVGIERSSAEAILKHLQDDLRARRAAASLANDPQRLERELLEQFRAHPRVAELDALIETDEEKLTQAKRLGRNPRDPAIQGIKKRLDERRAQYNELWRTLAPRLRQRLASGEGARRDEVLESRAAEVRDQQLKVFQFKKQEELLAERLNKLEIEVKATGDDALEIQFAKEELSTSQEQRATVERNLKQLEYEAMGNTRISQIARAKPSFVPISNNRAKLMAAAPVGVLVLVLGLFVLVEARSGRVADPDELPGRVRVGVLGVVPPLPSAKRLRGSGQRALRDNQRRVDEFVQSLDHLRVALCADRPGLMAGHRCILITSACGGEGKTTLAAQLAGRCANAGLSTLLIDADLRRPSLGNLLEVAPGPGLADVLAGEAEPETALVVIGNAGGFHLLPAGTSGLDPSRLLQGDVLGQLVARFRGAFDVVLIDAPPVLAVPDALLLGRWADGAILAVRHDASRFPLVDRAHRRLASVGVNVLGAVVNGVRSMESAYGYGSYGYGPNAEPETTAESPTTPA